MLMTPLFADGVAQQSRPGEILRMCRVHLSDPDRVHDAFATSIPDRWLPGLIRLNIAPARSPARVRPHSGSRVLRVLAADPCRPALAMGRMPAGPSARVRWTEARGPEAKRLVE